jgi:WD repeat and SOF domain-containing protein 1
MNNLKIKVISRNPDHYQRETKHDIYKVPQKNGGNEDPLRHTVENTRAMDAAKLERVLAKPFIACFDGHNKGVWNIIKAYFTAITFIIWYKRWSS